MDQAARDRIQHEIEDEANKLFPGSVRRVTLVQAGEPGEPHGRFLKRNALKPGELLAQVVLAQFSDGPMIDKLRRALSAQLPELRQIEVVLEDGADGKGRPVDGGVTPVMVRLTAAELETVDTLITAGIANSRAEAIRWALTRIRERSAYERLRRHAHEIERLKAEF
jgi:hypothetical protein